MRKMESRKGKRKSKREGNKMKGKKLVEDEI